MRRRIAVSVRTPTILFPLVILLAACASPLRGDLSVTKIVRPSVIDTGRTIPVPEPVVIGATGRMPPVRVIDDDYLDLQTTEALFNTEDGAFDPAEDAIDFYESLEGMLVQVSDAVSVGVVHEAFGEIFVLPNNGAGAGLRTPRGGIVVREGDFNPERVLIDFKEEFPPYVAGGTPRVGVGDRFTQPVIGVVSYSYSNYKVLPLGPLPTVVQVQLERETVTPITDDAVLSVAAFNVQNLSAESEATRFLDIAETIAHGLAAPDIVVLAEIQDNDGAGRSQSAAADRTAARLLTAIGSVDGPDDYRYIDIAPEFNRDGGQPNANIRVAFLYRTGRVSLPERGEPGATVAVEVVPSGPSLMPNPGRISPESRAFAASRKPLAAEFVFAGQKVFVVSSHFSSKGGDGGSSGAISRRRSPRRCSATCRPPRLPAS